MICVRSWQIRRRHTNIDTLQSVCWNQEPTLSMEQRTKLCSSREHTSLQDVLSLSQARRLFTAAWASASPWATICCICVCKAMHWFNIGRFQSILNTRLYMLDTNRVKGLAITRERSRGHDRVAPVNVRVGDRAPAHSIHRVVKSLEVWYAVVHVAGIEGRLELINAGPNAEMH